MKSLVFSVSPNTSTDRISVVDNFVAGEPSRTVLSFDQAGGSGALCGQTWRSEPRGAAGGLKRSQTTDSASLFIFLGLPMPSTCR